MRDRFYLVLGDSPPLQEFATAQDREDAVKRLIVSGEFLLEEPETLLCLDLEFDGSGEPTLTAWGYSNAYLEDFLSDN